jgi:hypothetical protein
MRSAAPAGNSIPDEGWTTTEDHSRNRALAVAASAWSISNAVTLPVGPTNSAKTAV